MSELPPPPWIPLEQRSPSATNSTASTINGRTVRLVPSEDLRLPGPSAEAPTIRRTPLPTHPSHFLSPTKIQTNQDYFYGFQNQPKTPPSPGSTRSSVSTIHTTPQTSQNVEAISGSSTPKPKYVPKKKLQLHKDNKTFSLVPQDSSSPAEEQPQSPRSIDVLSTKSSFDFLPGEKIHAQRESNSTGSCVPESILTGSTAPSTPEPAVRHSIPADPITDSPWNYQLVGGIRKVAKTPDTKERPGSLASESSPPLPVLSETSDEPTSLPQGLSYKQSFQSAQTESTTSENTNYKLYGVSLSPSVSESNLIPPSSSDSNYHLLGDLSSSPGGSVIVRPRQVTESEYENDSSVIIHRPQTPESETVSENENYELHGDPSAPPSAARPPPQAKYSQESLVVAPLKPRTRRSSESLGLGYYKSRSRESLRKGSLTSISTVLSHKEATRSIGGSGSLIDLSPPLPPKPKAGGSWVDSLTLYPLRHMEERPHIWSSQLSTVLSVSDGSGTDRGSRSWSDDNGRMSGSGFVPSSASRHSRNMLSISSSMASPLSPMDGDLEPPLPAYSQNRRHNSTSSVPVIEDVDEYGDGITDMPEVRLRSSRTRLSSLYGASSENGRTNTMRSSASSTRTNSLLSATLPGWARLYYGSGERAYLGVPGGSTIGDSRASSRMNSLRNGSPNTDGFPDNLFSPRRRPREGGAQVSPSRRSLEITPAPIKGGSTGPILRGDPFAPKFRTWSMSSIWSAHLRLDRRATRHSMWEPPSVNWSTEGGWHGRRNIQIIMFIVGFIIPFAWMIASLLPLPKRQLRDMEERDHDTHSSNDRVNHYARQFRPMDDARFESARWWRKLNRIMSIPGVLIIAAVVVLVVVAMKENW
ncbi:hypothetical protein BJ878DRAFT_210521 [Calycina marina]|uniref:Serine-rich protein n=1 Tax=Calycina marina TaxID=1763456 RepID=A0A9P8CCL2_9HELO|nr:hypothetical protein BJ878DRAFT_210521 [Calycina marina]